ncbi:MAG: protocatechuate 3,4-dioxygenase subunit alpha [Anaerolineales bacterium]|nr:protocatechuate 3,4-dioxygenase subunit alpha [Anaerolineales bacterium]
MEEQTPSQTVGPFFAIGLISGQENVLVNDQTAGERILIEGTVLDGDGQPISDAMVEIWQADAQGVFNHELDPNCEEADKNFRGFGRARTDDRGRYEFKTIKPGPVRHPDGQYQARHINVRVFARGMLTHATTRMYFSDDGTNSSDPVLLTVQEGRRSTLIGERIETEDLPAYHFDIHLQGDRETVFFDP